MRFSQISVHDNCLIKRSFFIEIMVVGAVFLISSSLFCCFYLIFCKTFEKLILSFFCLSIKFLPIMTFFLSSAAPIFLSSLSIYCTFPMMLEVYPIINSLFCYAKRVLVGWVARRISHRYWYESDACLLLLLAVCWLCGALWGHQLERLLCLCLFHV